ncbi:unnamed protein product [Darwinula stevensoni]|uniref:PDZ domain-containing protein n=1 Tax=Darwinula stevensoni TaxID=69355 RepID=A0A7R9AAY8_9CRUS|nr:unnamed protein product [Darwinula stevensoni]CAG0898737.1 unnamed protein product [Darwinula stevensoni]
MSFDTLDHLVPPESTFQVTLEKTAQGLGVSVTGGREARNHRLRGFFWIKKVFPITPAWEQGILTLGDIILKANGIPLIWLTRDRSLVTLSKSEAVSIGSPLTMWDASTDSPTPEMFGSPPRPTSLDLASPSSRSSSLRRQQFILPSPILGDSPDHSLASLPPEIEPSKKFQRNHEYMSANWNERSRGGKTSDGDMGLLKCRGTVFNEPDDHIDWPNDAEDVVEIGISPSGQWRGCIRAGDGSCDRSVAYAEGPHPHGARPTADRLHFVTFCTSAFHCVSSIMKIGIVFLLFSKI